MYQTNNDYILEPLEKHAEPKPNYFGLTPDSYVYLRRKLADEKGRITSAEQAQQTAANLDKFKKIHSAALKTFGQESLESSAKFYSGTVYPIVEAGVVTTETPAEKIEIPREYIESFNESVDYIEVNLPRIGAVYIVGDTAPKRFDREIPVSFFWTLQRSLLAFPGSRVMSLNVNRKEQNAEPNNPH
jgi:hypothetical protein